MVQDSSGFQSQQFVEQIAQRRDRYAAQNIDTARQASAQLGDLPGKFMQARGAAMEQRWGNEDRQFRNEQALVQQQQFEQEQQLRRSQVANDLANDQLHRQQGLEDLQWAQQLHQTDMIALTKDGLAADIALKKAQTQKAIDELGGDRIPVSMLFDQERMDYAISELGINFNPSDRKARPATPEERSVAAERRKAWLQQEQDFKLEQIERRNQGRTPPDPNRGRTAEINAAGNRLEQIKEVIAEKEREARKSEDPTQKAMIEQELIGLKRTAKQIGDKIDQSLLGGQQEQPVESDDPSVQQTMVDELDALHKTLDRVLGGPK